MSHLCTLKGHQTYLVIFAQPRYVSRSSRRDPWDEDTLVVELVRGGPQTTGDTQTQTLPAPLELDPDLLEPDPPAAPTAVTAWGPMGGVVGAVME